MGEKNRNINQSRTKNEVSNKKNPKVLLMFYKVTKIHMKNVPRKIINQARQREAAHRGLSWCSSVIYSHATVKVTETQTAS